MRSACWVALFWMLVGIVTIDGETVSGGDGADPFFAPSPALYGMPCAKDPETDSQATDPASLPRRLGRDFKRVFTTRENLAILGVGAGGVLIARSFDDRIVSSALNGELNSGGRLDATFEAGEIYGGALAQGVGALAIWGVGSLADKPRVQALGSDLVRAQIVNQVLTQSLKYAVGRTRPDGSNDRSFPSGHSSGAFATATVFQRHFGLRAGVPAYALAGYTAASRLSESKHYLTDVIFGAAIGILAGRSVTFDLGKSRFAVVPAPAPGGGVAVQLTWLGQSIAMDSGQ